MPSIVQLASWGRVPFEAKLDCWPVSLPPLFTRSTSTPGTLRISANGSREVGILVSSSVVKLVAVPVTLVSTNGLSPVTVMVSATAARRSCTGMSASRPTATTTPSRLTLAKPVSSTVTEYEPGGWFKNRNRPEVSVTAVCVRSDPCRVTVTPGSTAFCSSVTVPAMLPPEICAYTGRTAMSANSAAVNSLFIRFSSI